MWEGIRGILGAHICTAMEKLRFPVFPSTGCPALGGPGESEEHWVADVSSGIVWGRGYVDRGEKRGNWVSSTPPWRTYAYVMEFSF